MKISRAYSELSFIKLFGYALLFSLSFISCEREKPPIPDPIAPIHCWDKFIGNYIVYDTALGRVYEMQIEHFSSPNQFGIPIDSIIVTNLDSNFIIREHFSCGTNSNDFILGIMNNCETYNNKHYNFTLYEDDSSTPLVRENNLFNDTIILYFNKENTAYWMSEGVLYEDDWHTHIAVKQD
jgi:hypothetical protein